MVPGDSVQSSPPSLLVNSYTSFKAQYKWPIFCEIFPIRHSAAAFSWLQPHPVPPSTNALGALIVCPVPDGELPSRPLRIRSPRSLTSQVTSGSSVLPGGGKWPGKRRPSVHSVAPVPPPGAQPWCQRPALCECVPGIGEPSCPLPLSLCSVSQLVSTPTPSGGHVPSASPQPAAGTRVLDLSAASLQRPRPVWGEGLCCSHLAPAPSRPHPAVPRHPLPGGRCRGEACQALGACPSSSRETSPRLFLASR